MRTHSFCCINKHSLTSKQCIVFETKQWHSFCDSLELKMLKYSFEFIKRMFKVVTRKSFIAYINISNAKLSNVWLSNMQHNNNSYLAIYASLGILEFNKIRQLKSMNNTNSSNHKLRSWVNEHFIAFYELHKYFLKESIFHLHAFYLWYNITSKSCMSNYIHTFVHCFIGNARTITTLHKSQAYF